MTDVPLIIRPCDPADLPALARSQPIGDGSHQHRLAGQHDGRWLYLLACAPEPVGGCLVHWDGPVLPDVAAALPGCVEVNHLYVLEAARGRGAGRALLEAAERASRARNRALLGLGVGDENPGARRLYLDLGYRPTGVRFSVDYEYLDVTGRPVAASETGDFLTKPLE